MKLFRVLHLSDIHIGDTYMDSRDIAYRIISDIENENMNNIQCVIVTGDIFEGQCGEDEAIVSEAIAFFNIIYSELKETTNIEKNDFLFAPGNHDLIREDSESERWRKYDTFLKGFYGTLPNFYDSQDFSLLKIYEDSRIAFAGFNSCGLKEDSLIDEKLLKNIKKIDKEQYEAFGIDKQVLFDFIETQTGTKAWVDFGEIPPKQILKVKRELNKYDDYNIVAFFHHHFYLFPEVYTKYGDSSLIRNYTNVIQQMQQAGVKTVLHGHKHFDLERPLITDSYYESANHIINVIAGGSVGTSRTSKHTFNIIDFYDKDSNLKLVQRKFVYNNDQLEPLIVREIPPKVRENNASIQLLSVLKLNNPDLYFKYMEAIDKINVVADDYNNMYKWLENIFIGFSEIHKMFESNPTYVFFLLYAMNYRILKIKQVTGKECIDESYYNILNDLLCDVIPDVGFDKKRYMNIFEYSDLNKLKEECDIIFGTIQNKKEKYYISFSMIAIFITDIYLMLRYYAGSFYNRYIQYKVNIKLDENEFHQNVPVQKIMIHSDADRRSAFIDLRCNSATAHKLAVLFVKEFELIISKYEDYFKNVGLKLYYLIPKIEKNNISNTIDNYNFEAYIPTLIPLLTGDNIYARKEVFARELIQNSIDAIAVRASVESDFDQTIYITLGEDNGRRFFRIKDYGTGMDRFKIERYFTSIGRSFYSGDEYRELELDYKPISNFGIGFLSAFMICREIDVKTRYYLDEKEGLQLHIPNYDGCFFIEKNDALDIGTEITLYIDKIISNNIELEEIINYIYTTMQDITYNIVIQDKINGKVITLEARKMRKSGCSKNMLFVPFLEVGDIEENVNIKEVIWSEKFINKYSYGLFINLSGWEDDMGPALNSGIKLYDTDIDDIWRMLFKKDVMIGGGKSNFFLFNFPSNYLNVDVSREKITEFIDDSINFNLKTKLLKEVYRQLMEYMDLSKTNETDVKAINVHTLMMQLVELCKIESSLVQLSHNIMSVRYLLYIRFNVNTIDMMVGKSGDKSNNAIAYIKNNYSKCREGFLRFIENNANGEDMKMFEKQNLYFHKMISDVPILIKKSQNWMDKPLNYHRYYSDEKFLFELKEHLQKIIKEKKDNILYVFLFISAFRLSIEERSEHSIIMENVLEMLLKDFSVSEVENNKACVSISYSDIKRVIKRLV